MNESVNAGFEAPEGLRDKLAAALKKIVSGQTSSNAFEKSFALFVLTRYRTGRRFQIDRAPSCIYVATKPGTKAGLARDSAASAQHHAARERGQLLREIDAPIKERAFDPRTLGSTTRAEAICALAFNTIAPKIWTNEKKQRVRGRMLALMRILPRRSRRRKIFGCCFRVQIDDRR